MLDRHFQPSPVTDSVATVSARHPQMVPFDKLQLTVTCIVLHTATSANPNDNC
jgi:hypothetical protein